MIDCGVSCNQGITVLSSCRLSECGRTADNYRVQSGHFKVDARTHTLSHARFIYTHNFNRSALTACGRTAVNRTVGTSGV